MFGLIIEITMGFGLIEMDMGFLNPSIEMDMRFY